MNPTTPWTRREVLKTLGAGALGLGGLAARAVAAAEPAGNGGGERAPFTLPKLDYAYDALEPHIDARTMEIHHTKHHQAYIANANKALAEHPDLQQLTAEELLERIDTLPASVRATLRNNVGGHVNHSFFWRVIGPKSGGAPQGKIGDEIGRAFGSFEAFKTQFGDAAMKRFGSGWAWLVAGKTGALAVTSTANQDSPISEGATPLLGLDVWEHAYYLKYQNRRADYVAAFWNVVNWDRVEANLGAAPRVK